ASRCPSCPPESSSCPNKWTKSDDKCFYVSQNTKNWQSSREFCELEGGTLLNPDQETQEEIGLLHDLTGDYWVGLIKHEGSGHWRRLDGSVWTGQIEYDDPQRRVPQCIVEDSGKFVALDCSSARRWICVKTLNH
ncbi:hypothetical protein GDO81_027000, partial [Engystomops pustulosus]